jgi:protoporphyrinogen oxidase
MKIKTDILIIGAGPAGLAAAAELAKAKKDFVIVEKALSVGGLSKTYEFREDELVFRTDNGPHRFFSKNPALYAFIEGLLDEKWIEVKRQTRQLIDGKFYDYPINAVQALRNVGLARACRMALDLFFAKVKYRLFRRPIRNFADYVYANFGKTLGDFNMINYTEKIWGIPAQEIHVDWASQRIKGLSAIALVKDAFARILGRRGTSKPKSLVDSFYYPETGTGLIYETVKADLESKGYRFIMGAEPVKISCEGNRIKRAVCKHGNEGVQIEFNSLVESIHLPRFLSLLSPKPPLAIKKAAERMRYRSQVYLFITLDKERVTDDQWIYFPSKDIPIGRISEPGNFSRSMSPSGKTSLFIEFFCNKGDKVWGMKVEELFEYALPHLERAGLVRRNEVRKSYLIREEDVYPIYDTAYQEYLGQAKAYLDRFENLYYIGRPGRFRYNNQDHSLEMGFLAAKALIDGKRYDIDSVGAEREYYEKGKNPAKTLDR